MALPFQASPPVRPLCGPATNSKFQVMPFTAFWSLVTGHWSPLSGGDARHVQPRAHDRADHRDVERAPVAVAPRDIGRVVPRRLDAREDAARLVVHVNAPGRRAIDVALDIALDAVRH